MRGIRTGALGLLLGWGAAASAGDIVWTPAASPPLVASSSPTPMNPRPAGVSLGRPMPAAPMDPERINYPAILDPHVARTSYQAPVVESKDIWKRAKGYESAPSPAAGPVGAATTQAAALDEEPAPPTFAVESDATGVLPEPGGPLGSSPWCGSAAGAGEVWGEPGERFYASGEYLLWWTKAPRFPPLATTSPPASAGILGQPGTRVLFGGSTVDQDARSGGRFTAGYWLDSCQQCAIEGSFFFLGDRSTNFSANSTNFPLLARPFFNLNQGIEFAEITAAPGLSSGRITVSSPSRLWGAEVNVRHNWCCGCSYRVDWLAGFRYLDLSEGLDITESIQSGPNAPAFPNSQIFVNDSFHTKNQFYGGQVGTIAEFQRGRWFLDARGKIALGDTHQVIDINGSQVIIGPNGSTSRFAGGLLALNSNIGHHTRERFTVVPEVGVDLGYQVTDHWRAFVGYSFLYWSNVVRPGDQIDRGLDVTRIPNFPVPGTAPLPQPRPTVPFRGTDYWAQGINFGLEFRY